MFFYPVSGIRFDSQWGHNGIFGKKGRSHWPKSKSIHISKKKNYDRPCSGYFRKIVARIVDKNTFFFYFFEILLNFSKTVFAKKSSISSLLNGLTHFYLRGRKVLREGLHWNFLPGGHIGIRIQQKAKH